LYSCSAFSTPYLPSPRYLSVYALFLFCSLCSCSHSVHNLSDHCSFCWCIFTLQFFSTPCSFITVYHFTLISYSILCSRPSLFIRSHYTSFFFKFSWKFFSFISFFVSQFFKAIIAQYSFVNNWGGEINSMQIDLSDFQFQVSLFYFWQTRSIFLHCSLKLISHYCAIFACNMINIRKCTTLKYLLSSFYLCVKTTECILYQMQHLACS